MLSTGANVLFCGHTHVPYIRQLESGQLQVRVYSPGQESARESAQESAKESSRTTKFDAPLKRIVNAGSVGEPRHGRPNATYVLYDTDTEQVTLREVEYDYHKTCADIVAKGLSPIFAWRLAHGLEFAERADDPTHVCER